TADLIVDSLVYWAREVQVDGFRFDLMAALARDAHHVFDPQHPLLDRIRNHPDLQDTLVIAEPWDVGPDGWKTGSFGAAGERTSEWNDGFRNTVRQFWLTDIAEERRNGTPATGIGALAGALTGSRHLFGTARGPLAGINFVTAHDGFTLLDLVAHDRKHNEANGEENRDGESHNRSWNCGEEGPTGNADVIALRQRQSRNFLATLFLSQGVPMLCGGDEIGRTQGGNNNGYCQDNEISWYDWKNVDEPLLLFTRMLLDLRKKHRIFHRRRWFQGRPLHGSDVKDIAWFTPQGKEMTDEDWSVGYAKSLGVFLNGDAIATPDEAGERIVDESFYVVFNAHHEPMKFTLPEERFGKTWVEIIDTNDPPRRRDRRQPREAVQAGSTVEVAPRSFAVFERED
ncbi:MAG: glycogen debranching enzyme, partial [Myxococcales bacterium]